MSATRPCRRCGAPLAVGQPFCQQCGLQAATRRGGSYGALTAVVVVVTVLMLCGFSSLVAFAFVVKKGEQIEAKANGPDDGYVHFKRSEVISASKNTAITKCRLCHGIGKRSPRFYEGTGMRTCEFCKGKGWNFWTGKIKIDPD